jgi:hypothetical protein
VSPVKYELGFYIPEDGVIHSHRREKVKFYKLFLNYVNLLPLRMRYKHSVAQYIKLQKNTCFMLAAADI